MSTLPGRCCGAPARLPIDPARLGAGRYAVEVACAQPLALTLNVIFEDDELAPISAPLEPVTAGRYRAAVSLTAPTRYASLEVMPPHADLVQDIVVRRLAWTHLIARGWHTAVRHALEPRILLAKARQALGGGSNMVFADKGGGAFDYARWQAAFESDREAAAVLAALAQARGPGSAPTRVLAVVLPGALAATAVEEGLASLAAADGAELHVLDLAAEGDHAVPRRASLARSFERQPCHPGGLLPGTLVMQAIRRTGAELVLFLDRPGRFHRLAVAALALALHRNAEAVACYGDHDLVDAAGHREAPVFKPAWSPDYLASCNYIGQPVAFRGDAAFFETLGSAISLACPTFSLLMRRAAAASALPVAHVPRVLFHQRREGSLASLDARMAEEGRIVAAACGAGATVMAEPGAAWRRVRHLTGATPLAVSVICPSKDNPELLRRACDSVLRAKGVSVRLVIVDNGAGTEAQRSLLAELARLANVRVLPAPGPFNFSRLINQGRAAADGDVLVLLNDDVEATEPEWLTELASQAARPEIGCVGALLLYPDRRIQHAGVTLGFFGGAAHAFRYWPEQAEDEALRLKSVHEVAAVTAACLAVRASVFDEAGGFSEELAVALNDVDFCLKVCSLGYRNIVTPHARLVHHESASRGLDSTPEKWRRFSKEAALFRRRWGEAALRDPYVSQHCSPAHDDYRPRRL